MKGLKGYSTASLNQLIGAYGNDMVNVLTGTGFGVNLSSTNNVEFENFLESLFFQNYNDTPLSYNGSVWSRRHCAKLPVSKFIKGYNERLYLGFIKIGNQEYPSRVWFSDLPVNDTIQWGYERGTNLKTTAGSNRVRSELAGFKGYNLKIGNPFFILSGSDAGEYRIQDIISDQEVNLADSNGGAIVLSTTATSIPFWAGGNYFDVLRDDGDFITWLEYNFDQLIIYKRESTHRYNGSARSQIKGGPGTTSGRSVVNLRDWTIHFYGGLKQKTGFYAYDSSEIFKISNGIQKYIDGINPNMFFSVIAWEEGNLYRCYVGDIENTDYGISIPDAVITMDYDTKAWSVDPIGKEITVATKFREINTVSSYIGNNTKVYQTPNGSTFNGSPIMWTVTTKPFYPEGTAWNNTFTKLQVISENANGVKVSYKKFLNPFDTDTNFTPLGDIRHDSEWFVYPEENNRSSGIQLRFDGVSSTEPVSVIKKLTQFYRKETSYVQ